MRVLGGHERGAHVFGRREPACLQRGGPFPVAFGQPRLCDEELSACLQALPRLREGCGQGASPVRDARVPGELGCDSLPGGVDRQGGGADLRFEGGAGLDVAAASLAFLLDPVVEVRELARQARGGLVRPFGLGQRRGRLLEPLDGVLFAQAAEVAGDFLQTSLNGGEIALGGVERVSGAGRGEVGGVDFPLRGPDTRRRRRGGVVA